MILEGILLQPPPELLRVRLDPHTHTRGNCLPLECRVYFGSFACAYDDGSAAADDDDVPGSSAGIPDQRMHVRRDSQTMCGPRKRLRIQSENLRDEQRLNSPNVCTCVVGLGP